MPPTSPSCGGRCAPRMARSSWWSVSRDTSERHAIEEELRKSEARLRAATELAGLGIYSWDPVTGALEWDDRMRAMWGLPPNVEANMDVFEAGIHPDEIGRGLWWGRV